MGREMPQRLANRISRSLKPIRVVGRLFSRQNIHETTSEMVKIIRIFDVLIQRSRVELRQNEHPSDAAIDAI